MEGVLTVTKDRKEKGRRGPWLLGTGCIRDEGEGVKI